MAKGPSYFCDVIGCPHECEARVWIDDIGGSAPHGRYCRDDALAEYERLGTKHPSAAVSIAWHACQRCGGEGGVDGKLCGDCDDLTVAGGPLRLGDFVHSGSSASSRIAIALLPPANEKVTIYILHTPGTSLPAMVHVSPASIWSRCGFGSPCQHPKGAEEAFA